MKKTLLAIFMATGLALVGCAKSKDTAADTPGNQPYWQPPYPGQGGYNLGGPRLAATLSITNAGVFSQLLEFSGRCIDKTRWYYGSNRCSNYSSKGYVIINSPAGTPADGTQFIVEIVGGANSPNDSYNGGGWNMMTFPLKMTFPMRYQSVNNNQGFTLFDGSQFNYPTGRVRVRADVGSVTANAIPVILEYNNQEFARTTVYRW